MKPRISLPLLGILAGFALPASTALSDGAANPPPPPPPAPPAQQESPAGAGEAPAPRHRMGPGYSLEELTGRLGLSADQQKRIGALIDAGRSQARALRNDDSLSWDDRRGKVREIARSTREQIRAALTPDQQKAFDALPPRGGGPRGPDPGQ